MIFTPESIDLIAHGLKTQTRRPVGEQDRCETRLGAEGIAPFFRMGRLPGGDRIVRVTTNGRLKWVVGRTYAMNPPPPKGSKARMGKQVGRILLKTIRCERVCDITGEDALAEGVVLSSMGLTEADWSITFKGETFTRSSAPETFLAGWKKFYHTDLRELVWVLEFEMVEP